MALAPDSLVDIAKVFVARAATAGSCKRHEASFAFIDLPSPQDLTPPCLRPPAELPPEQNGYLAALRIAHEVPPDSPTECNAIHRALSLVQSPCPRELEVSQRAIGPYESLLDDLLRVLAEYPRWQTPSPSEDAELPELPIFRRLGHGLLLRGVARRCAGDESAAAGDIKGCLELARRLRNCEGFLLHLLVGIALESIALKVLRRMLPRPESRDFALECLSAVRVDGRKAETAEAFRSEFARVGIPRALHVVRPWKPVPAGSPAWFEFPHLAAQLALVNHPSPYNPIETAMELTCIGEVFLAWIEEGWSVAPAIETMRKHYAVGWPEEIAASAIACRQIRFASILRARRALLGTENPYGRLICARTLYTAIEVYRASLMGELRACVALVLGAACRLGRAPSCLEELVGNGLLAEIPIDPFTDSPLRYEPSEAAVWSPGPCAHAYAEAKKCAASSHDSPYWLPIG